MDQDRNRKEFLRKPRFDDTARAMSGISGRCANYSSSYFHIQALVALFFFGASRRITCVWAGMRAISAAK